MATKTWPKQAGWWLSGALVAAGLSVSSAMSGYLILSEMFALLAGCVAFVLVWKKEAHPQAQRSFRNKQLIGCILAAVAFRF